MGHSTGTREAVTIGWTGGPGSWRGTLKVGRKVVWTCPHHHPNRDQASTWWGPAAQGCARLARELALNPDHERVMRSWDGWRTGADVAHFQDLLAELPAIRQALGILA